MAKKLLVNRISFQTETCLFTFFCMRSNWNQLIRDWEFQANLRDSYALPVSGCNFAGLVQTPSPQTMLQCFLWKFALQSFSSGTQCLVQKNEFSIQKNLYIVYITTAAIVYDTADILRDRCPKQDSNNMKNCRTSKQHNNKLEKLHCLRKKDVCIN